MKLLEFGDTKRSLRAARESVKFLGLLFLDWITLFEVFVVWISGITVGIGEGFHGHDGSGTTEVVFGSVPFNQP